MTLRNQTSSQEGDDEEGHLQHRRALPQHQEHEQADVLSRRVEFEQPALRQPQRRRRTQAHWLVVFVDMCLVYWL